MYNQTAVLKGGYSPRTDSGRHAAIDTTHFLTAARGNQLFVNETGDGMSGDLDMRNNKIVNVGAPTRNTDASNKFYVDDRIAAAVKNYVVLVREVDKLGASIKKLAEGAKPDDVTKTKLDDLTARVTAMKTEIDAHIRRVEMEISTKIASDRVLLGKLESAQDALQKDVDFKMSRQHYGIRLFVGRHDATAMKTLSYTLRFPFPISNYVLNLQLTLIHQTWHYDDRIVSFIRNYKAIDDALSIEVSVVRVGGVGWGIDLHADLLITFNKQDTVELKSGETHSFTE